MSAKSIVSKTEDDNKVVRTFGEVNKELVVDGQTLGKLHHHQIMECLDMVELREARRSPATEATTSRGPVCFLTRH